MRPTERDRGAAAVEMALVLPVLVAILLGIIEFGRVLNTQQVLTHAAREGVRAMVLENSPVAARIATREAASVLGILPDSSMTISPAACTPGARVSVTVSYTLPSTGFFGQFPLQGKGVMLCGG